MNLGESESEVLVAQLCPTLCDAMDSSPPSALAGGFFTAEPPGSLIHLTQHPISNFTRTYNLLSVLISLFLITFMHSFSSFHSLDIVADIIIYPIHKLSTISSIPSWQNSNAGLI